MKWTEQQAIITEKEYSSGQWIMRKDEKFFVSNFDILLSPSGYGSTEQAAFEDMLENIAAYEQKLKRIRAEIQEHLNELKGENHD